MRARCAKTAERIDILFGVETPRVLGPEEHYIRCESQSPHGEGRGIRRGLRQITLSTCCFCDADACDSLAVV